MKQLGNNLGEKTKGTRHLATHSLCHFHKNDFLRGAWLALSVEHASLGLRVVKFKLHTGCRDSFKKRGKDSFDCVFNRARQLLEIIAGPPPPRLDSRQRHLWEVISLSG